MSKESILTAELNHHAYGIIADISIVAKLLVELENTHKISTRGNPDFHHQHFDNFTIDDARAIKSTHLMRPVGATGKKIFVLSIHSIGHEAQNALLKMLEEPAEYAHFFLIVPSESMLLPTVRSRLRIIYVNGEKNASRNGSSMVASAQNIEIADLAATFLKQSRVKRLETIKKIIEDITKEKKTKQYAVEFLNAVQKLIYERGDIRNVAGALHLTEVVRKYIHDRGAGTKMLLEYVALVT